MKDSLFSKRTFDVRFLYVAAALIVALGYLFMFRGYDDAIAVERDNADRARLQTVQYEARIGQRRAFNAEMFRLRRQLASLELTADTSTTVAHFLRDVAGTAARARVTVVAVESDPNSSALAASRSHPLALPSPTPVPTAPQSAPFRSGAAIAATGVRSPAPQAQPFDEIPLQLTLHGSYQNLLACTRALTHMRVLARVDVLALSRLKLVHPGSSPNLAATVHVTLYHIAGDPSHRQGLRDAVARPS